MANRQPGHYTFGRRNSIDIYKIYDMVGDEYTSGTIVLPYTRVYDTDYGVQKNRSTSWSDVGLSGVWLGDNQTPVPFVDLVGTFTGTVINFYTGMAVAIFGTGTTANTGSFSVAAKSSANTENIIGIVAGGTGPTSANLTRGPFNTGNFTGTIGPKFEDIVVQYAGQCPVLLDQSEPTSVRGQYLFLSSGVSGASIADIGSNVGAYGVCLANAYASGMTAGHGPGLTGLLGNYVNGFIRPVETN